MKIRMRKIIGLKADKTYLKDFNVLTLVFYTFNVVLAQP